MSPDGLNSYGANPYAHNPVNPYGANPYGANSAAQYPHPGLPLTDPWVEQAEQLLGGAPFSEPDAESASPIWARFRELVESRVDSDDRDSVLRAGWLALRGEIGEEA